MSLTMNYKGKTIKIDDRVDCLKNALKSGRISIDSLGRIWRNGERTENIITNKGDREYFQLSLSHNGKRYVYMVQRVVWEFFNSEIPIGCMIHHIDENTLNNNPNNLKCVTYSWHNKHHPRTPWNKGLSGNDISIWHNKTIISKRKNYIQYIKDTYTLKHDDKMKVKDIAKLQGTTLRSVYHRLKDYREEVMP